MITLKGFNNQFISGLNGIGPMICNRPTASDWERFTVVDAGNGNEAVRSSKSAGIGIRYRFR